MTEMCYPSISDVRVLCFLAVEPLEYSYLLEALHMVSNYGDLPSGMVHNLIFA